MFAPWRSQSSSRKHGYPINGNSFIIFCLQAKDPRCNQCCSLELSLGRKAKILIDVLAFWSNDNGPEASVLDRLQNSRFRTFSEGAILACEAREPHTPGVSPHSPSPFSHSLQTFSSNIDRRSRSEKIQLFCSLADWTNKKLPVIPAGGFSVVSLPGSPRLRRSLALVIAASRLS